ncbi:MAG TPA: hypothetical protein VNG69_08120 [Casimicrobiaceae bacterium]|nr:hypothetical protein [Casimicrobiaceae bacterium]
MSRIAQRVCSPILKRDLLQFYSAQHGASAQITAAARKSIDEADAHIAERCRALGIPPEFRPTLSLCWFGRGENAVAGRRAELRRVAQTGVGIVWPLML